MRLSDEYKHVNKFIDIHGPCWCHCALEILPHNVPFIPLREHVCNSSVPDNKATPYVLVKLI